MARVSSIRESKGTCLLVSKPTQCILRMLTPVSGSAAYFPSGQILTGSCSSLENLNKTGIRFKLVVEITGTRDSNARHKVI
jgi:hypothetical protein